MNYKLFAFDNAFTFNLYNNIIKSNIIIDSIFIYGLISYNLPSNNNNNDINIQIMHYLQVYKNIIIQ